MESPVATKVSTIVSAATKAPIESVVTSTIVKEDPAPGMTTVVDPFGEVEEDLQPAITTTPNKNRKNEVRIVKIKTNRRFE